MDNFFEILIYLLIIISFLSGLFRKKDKKKRPQEQSPHTQKTNQQQPVKSAPAEEYDILTEIEDFFKVGDEESSSRQYEPPQTRTEERLDYKEHVQSDQWHQPTESEHKYTDYWGQKEKELKDKKSKIDSEIEQQAVEFEKHLKKTKAATSEFSKIVKEKLRKPASLKDYIIIAEIMGKPKAFRR